LLQFSSPMKISFKRHWPLLGIAILLLLTAGYLARAGKRYIENPAVIEELLSAGEGLKLEGMQYSQDDPDRGMKWKLDAREVRFSEDQSSMVFLDFHLTLEPENRAPVSLTGDRGDYSRSDGVIFLQGNLDAVSGDGYRLVTDSLSFDEKKRELTGRDRVKVTGPFFSVEGKGLFVDLNKRTFRVLSEVTTTIQKEVPLS
jgi:LPS export ABC transporter protein LptC